MEHTLKTPNEHTFEKEERRNIKKGRKIKSRRKGAFFLLVLLSIGLILFNSSNTEYTAKNFEEYPLMSFEEVNVFPDHQKISVSPETNSDLNEFSLISLQLVDYNWQGFFNTVESDGIENAHIRTKKGDVPLKVIENWLHLSNKIPDSMENHYIVESLDDGIGSLNTNTLNNVRIYNSPSLATFEASIFEITSDGKKIRRDIDISSGKISNTIKVGAVIYADDKTVFNRSENLSLDDKIEGLKLILLSLGIILEALILITGKIDLSKIRLSLKWSFIVMLFFSLFALNDAQGVGMNFIASYLFFVFVLIFSFIFGALFRKEILTKISGSLILLYTSIFWFVVIFFLHSTVYFYALAIPFGLITLYIIYILFFIHAPSYSQLISLVTWFLIMIISFAIFQLSTMFSAPLYQGSYYFYYVLLGMMYMYIAINFWYVFIFSIDSNKRKDVAGLEKYFIDYKIGHIPTTIIIILFQVGILVYNHYAEFISDYSMISIFIIFIIPLSLKYLNPKSSLLQAKIPIPK